jgi:HSP20 family protein
MATNLTRFVPFSELSRMDPFRGLEEVFNQALAGGPRFGAMGMTPRMDVTETDQAYVVKAEIPGIKKEDIKVNVDGNQVSISAQTQQESEQQGENMLVSERSWGQYYRSFTLPQAVDDTQAKAEYHDGILELSLPKKTGGTAKTLAIH